MIVGKKIILEMVVWRKRTNEKKKRKKIEVLRGIETSPKQLAAGDKNVNSGRRKNWKM